VVPSSRFHTRLRTDALKNIFIQKGLQEDLQDYIRWDYSEGEARYYLFPCLLNVLPPLRDLARDMPCGFGTLSDEKNDLGS
jgi:hypothetical protein